MLKKGQCSNSPSKCNFAKDGTLLPYAGPSSICPECGAPLALVAAPDGVVTPTQSTPKPVFEDDEDDYEAAPSQALEFAKIAGLIAILGTAAFFGIKFFANMNNNSGNEEITNSIGNQVTNVPVINEISPSQIAKVNNMLEVKVSPSMTSSSMGTLSIGTVVDINGSVSNEGIEWARIVLPNNSTQYGFVKTSDLIGLAGGDALVLDPSLAGVNAVSADVTPLPPVIGPITESSETLLYVSSQTANIRAEAGANATKVSEALRGDTVVASASRTVDGKKWYRINLPSGGQGWISATLLSNTKPSDEPKPVIEEKTPSKPVPIEEGTNVVFTSEGVKVRNIPENADGNEQAEGKRGMVVQVQEIENKDGVTWYKVRSKRFNIDGWVEGKSVKSAE